MRADLNSYNFSIIARVQIENSFHLFRVYSGQQKKREKCTENYVKTYNNNSNGAFHSFMLLLAVLNSSLRLQIRFSFSSSLFIFNDKQCDRSDLLTATVQCNLPIDFLFKLNYYRFIIQSVMVVSQNALEIIQSNSLLQ